MKKLIIAFIFIYSHSTAQVIKDVSFDNYVSPTNNDFTANFSGFTGLYQIPTGGITGGSLVTPDSNLWGNDNAVFCAKYTGQQGGLYVTSITFRYDSALIMNGTGDRPVSIWMQPFADFNHYLIASVLQDKRIQIISYSWVSPSAPPLNLVSGNWYRLTLQALFTGGATGDQIDIGAAVHNLGPNGLGLPGIMGSVNGSMNDLTLFSDTAIAVSITGSARGGSQYLDNFHFEGIPGSDICQPLAITEIDNELPQVSIVSNTLQITSAKEGKTVIYNTSGQAVAITHFKRGITSAFIDLDPGIYFITSQSRMIKKFVLAK